MRTKRFSIFLIGLFSLCYFTTSKSIVAAETLVIKNLRCEYLENPLGIDVLNPRLSWISKSDKRGQVQKAYQILVASTQQNLASDIGDLWD